MTKQYHILLKHRQLHRALNIINVLLHIDWLTCNWSSWWLLVNENIHVIITVHSHTSVCDCARCWMVPHGAMKTHRLASTCEAMIAMRSMTNIYTSARATCLSIRHTSWLVLLYLTVCYYAAPLGSDRRKHALGRLRPGYIYIVYMRIYTLYIWGADPGGVTYIFMVLQCCNRSPIQQTTHFLEIICLKHIYFFMKISTNIFFLTVIFIKYTYKEHTTW